MLCAELYIFTRKSSLWWAGGVTKRLTKDSLGLFSWGKVCADRTNSIPIFPTFPYYVLRLNRTSKYFEVYQTVQC